MDVLKTNFNKMRSTFFFLVIYLCGEAAAFSTGPLVSGRVRLPTRQTSEASSRLDVDWLTKCTRASNFRPTRSIDVLSMQLSSSLQENSSRNRKVTILGGGFGGLYTALNLARLARLPEQNFGKLEITLIDANDRFWFLHVGFEKLLVLCFFLTDLFSFRFCMSWSLVS